MTVLRTILISALACIGFLGAASTPPTLTDIDQFSFVNMQNDMTISASFTSAGCFHNDSGVMTFGPETLSYNSTTKPVSFRDMAGLDLYFRDLSTKQGQWGGCTSSTSLTLTLNQDGKAIGQISLKDDFCFREDGMISPNALRYKLFEQENDQQITLIED